MVRLKVLVVLGGGGHTRELLELFGDMDCRFEFVVSKREKLLSRLPAAKVYKVPCLREMDETFLQAILNILPSFFSAFRIVSRTDAQTIMTSGPAIAIPFLIAAKLMGKRVIYIETLSRVYTPSKTGRIAYRFADIFFVQWKGLKRKYPNSIYAGRLM